MDLGVDAVIADDEQENNLLNSVRVETSPYLHIL